MNDAPAEAADAIVVEDAPDVAASPNAGGEDSPGSLVHQGTIIDADIAVAEPHHPVASPAFADEAIAPEDDAVVAPASPQSDENLDDIDGDTAVRDDPTRSSPRPPAPPVSKKTQLCLRTSRIFFFSSPDLAFHYVNCRAKPRRMTARAPVRAHPDPRTGRSAMPKMSKKMPKKKKTGARRRPSRPLMSTTPSRI